MRLRIWIYWGLWLSYASVIYALSGMSLDMEWNEPSHTDKIIHAFEFGLFSLLAYLAIRESFPKVPIIYLAGIALLTSVLYGVFDEYHQLSNPSRQSDPLDVLADAFGAAATQILIVLKAYQRY